MAEKKLRFMVVFFSRNRRLILTIAVLAAIVLAVWLIVAFTNWLVQVNQDQNLPWTVVFRDENWQGNSSDATLPRAFVAGGTTYDRQILVDGWGMSAEVLMPIDYMEDLGIHILFGEVTKTTYSPGRLEINIREKSAGYELITISKWYLHEGDLQIIFADSQGIPVGYEEEFIYSVPVQYTLVDSGEADAKASAFMEVLDSETTPVLTGHDLSLVNQYPGCVLLYVQGGEVATIQRNANTLRIYTDPAPAYQVIAIPSNLLNPGYNSLRLIDSTDLSVKSQIIIQVAE